MVGELGGDDAIQPLFAPPCDIPKPRLHQNGTDGYRDG
jgi:hypothetical protein